MRYAVIMAGGAGKRLWPLSRLSRPKQLLPLLGGKSLLEMAVDRLAPVFGADNVLVITNAEYADQVADSVSSLKPENVIGEPEGRDTANAIALAAELLAARDPHATMAVFTADHVIRPQDRFAAAVERAIEAAESNPDALVTFGIRPTWPHTGLGYIHCPQPEGDARPVKAFREKPDHQTARRYVDSGEYFWNSGMFVWSLDAIHTSLREFLSDSMTKLGPIREAAEAGQDFIALLAEVYPTLERISIDYAVMEKAPTVLMVEMDAEWVDVGSWPALDRVSEQDETGNVVLAEKSLLLDSGRNVIVCEDASHLMAVVGMDDCIVVHAPDATLVCNKSDSQRIKELVALVEEKFGPEHL
ncbi:MAG: mannose-1-phosphate guanylyltransferase [Planctomycetota bacterium]